MLASYSKENGFEFIWNSLNRVKEITPEVQSQISKLTNTIISDCQGTAKRFEITDESVIEFMGSMKKSGTAYTNSTDALAGYKSYLQTTAKATALVDLKTKALSVSMKAVSIAANMALSLGIGLTIQLIDTVITKLIDTQEEVKQRVDDIMSSYNSALDSANSNASKVEEIASKYESLSKGINNLGENVSLTTEEYKEYQSITNDMANMFPQLITGYDEQGNTILSLKGNVESLRDAYKEAQKEAYRMLIVNEKDIMKDFSSNILKEGGTKDSIDVLERLTKASSPEEFRKEYQKILDEYDSFSIAYNHIGKALKDSGFDNAVLKRFSLKPEDLEKIKANAKITMQTYQAELDSGILKTKQTANAHLFLTEDIDEQTRSATSTLINTMDVDTVEKYKDKIGVYVNALINTFKDNPEVKNAMTELFTANFDEIPIEDAKTQIDSYIDIISKILDKDPLELKVQLGFDSYDKVASNYKEIMKQAAEKFSGESSLNISNRQNYLSEYQKIDEFAREQSINIQDELAYWNQCLEKAKIFEDAVEEFLSKPRPTDNTLSFFSETQQKEITDFQKGISSIDTALKSLSDGTLSSNDVLNLINEFQIDASKIDMSSNSFTGLKEELEKIADINLDSILANLKELYENNAINESAYQAISNLFLDIASNVGEVAKSLSDYQNELDNACNSSLALQEILADLKENGLKGMSSSSMSKIIKDYPTLLSYLNDENALRSGVNQLIEEQQNKADEMYKTIIESDENAFSTFLANENSKVNIANQTINSIIDGSNLMTKIFGQNYDFDLSNFKSLAEAKAEIESKLISALSEAWAKYYGTMQKVANLNSMILNASSAQLPGQDIMNQINGAVGIKDPVIDGLNNQLSNAQKERDKQKKIYDELNVGYGKMMEELNLYDGISINLPDAGNKKGNSGEKDSYSEFSQQIDWVTESIKLLENEVSKYQSLLDDSTAEKDKIKYLDLLIEKQTELGNAYGTSAKLYGTKYQTALSKLSKEDQNKVKNGSFTIENFSEKIKQDKKSGKTTGNQEKRYNNIEEALKYRDLTNDTNANYQDSISKIRDYANQLADVHWDIAQEKIEKLERSLDLLDSKLNNASGYKEKNKLLKERLALQKKIVDEEKKAIANSKKDLKSSKNTLIKTLQGKQKKLSVKNAIKNEDGTYTATSKATKKEKSDIASHNKMQKNIQQIQDGKIISSTGWDAQTTAYMEEYNAHVREVNENTKELNLSLEEQKTLQNDIWSDNAGNIQNDFDLVDESLGSDIDKIQSSISLKESAGLQGSKEDYEILMNLIADRSKVAANNMKELKSNLDNAKKSGTATKDSILELEIQLKNAENEAYQLKETLLDAFDASVNARVTSIEDSINNLQKQLDFLNDLKEKQDLAATGVNNFYDDQIKLIQKEINAMQKLNDEKDKQLELEKAQANLAKANQLTDKVYTEDKGFIYIANEENKKDAQNALNDMLFQREIDAKQEQINKLNEYKDKFNEMLEEYEKNLAKQYAATLLYNGWESDALNGRLDNFRGFADSVNGTKLNIDNVNNQIDSLGRQIESLQKWSDDYKQYALSVSGNTANLGICLTQGLNNMGVYTDGYMKYASASTDTTLQKGHADTLSELSEDEKETQNEKINSISQMEEFHLDQLQNFTQLQQKEYETRIDVLRNHVREMELLYDRLRAAQSGFGMGNTSGSLLGELGKATGSLLGKLGKASSSGKYDNSRGLSTVAEEKPEILIRDGSSYLLSEPQLLDVKSDDIILNGQDTEKVLTGKNENLIPIGNAYLNGNIELNSVPNILKNLNLNPIINDVIKPIADNSVKITMGDIKLEGVQNVDEFAKAIKQNYPSIVRQQLFRK